MSGSFPKCVWLCTHNKKTEEEEEVASFLHGMRAIIISTWQLQNVYRHRGGPHSSSCQSSGGREGRGQNIFSHMRAPIFTFMCAAMWVDLFYCKLRVVLINAWLFVLNVWKENWEKATWGSCHLLPAPCFLSLSLSINWVRVWSWSSYFLFHWLLQVNIQSNSVFHQGIFFLA